MLPLTRDFQEFLRLLNAHEVRYLVVGGHAVAYHGHVRNTGDLDLFVAADENNAKRLVAALNAFGFGMPQLVPELFTKPKSLVRMGREPSKLELMNHISGIVFDEAHSRREVVQIDDIEMPLLGYEDLLINKRASGREKDVGDVAELERARRRHRG